MQASSLDQAAARGVVVFRPRAGQRGGAHGECGTEGRNPFDFEAGGEQNLRSQLRARGAVRFMANEFDADAISTVRDAGLAAFSAGDVTIACPGAGGSIDEG